VNLKLDENLGSLAAGILRDAGHDVGTVRGQGLAGAPDNLMIEACRREGRCLVTLDREFGNPLLFNPAEYRGIALLRLRPRSTADDLYDAVRTLVGGLSRDDVDGKLWVVQRGRIRRYEPGEASG